MADAERMRTTAERTRITGRGTVRIERPFPGENNDGEPAEQAVESITIIGGPHLLHGRLGIRLNQNGSGQPINNHLPAQEPV